MASAYTRLDDGAVISVAVRVDRAARSAEIDFTGTSAQLPGNFNAPSSVAMAAVLYVLRTLVADEIPLNSGCLKPVTGDHPAGVACSPPPTRPRWPPGNVETSQAVTGALYAGARGAGRGLRHDEQRHPRQRALPVLRDRGQRFRCRRRVRRHRVVQTHMTNSRLTDPEVLEWRYPVRVE